MSSLTLARPYAKGAYAQAKQCAEVVVWSNALAQLAQYICVPEIWEIVKDPMVKKEASVSLLMQAANLNHAEIENFLALLAQYHRLALLPQIATLFTALQHEDEKIIDAELSTPFAISAEAIATIQKSLEKRFQAKVQLSTHVDPTLIGGAKVRIGDQVIDGTIKSKINDLTRHLLNYEGTHAT